MIFKDNRAVKSGGAQYSEKYSTSIFDGYSKRTFYNNSAQIGGAIITKKKLYSIHPW